jgi:hypothetical protein
MSVSKTIRDELIKKIGQWTMYSRMDKAKQIASHSITSGTALYVVASQENIPVATILKREQRFEELKEFQDAVKNFNFSPTKQNNQRQPKSEVSQKQQISKTTDSQSPIIKKIMTIGQKYGIENIDQNWIDALAILNFIETATTKVLMDHDYTEDDVKKMKWEEKLTKLQNKLHEEAKTAKVSIRTSVATFFKNYREVRNDQDHIAHLPTSHVTKDELSLLEKNLDVFIKTVFIEHKKYCLKNLQ